MSAPQLAFSRSEFAKRIEKTRKAMEDREVEVLIVSDPSNMAWLTGYDGWSFYVHQCVIVGPDGDPVWFGRDQDRNGAKRTCFMSEDDMIGYPDHYVQSDVRHPMDFLAARLEERGWDKTRIGVEMDNYWYTAQAHASLQQHLPNAAFVNANSLVNWQRAVKSDQELLYMQRAARIVERMHQRIF
ncbi:aminopeptidase P family N-terminal domain-containing protein, partial [Martelella sp. UBA3392]